MLRAVYPGSFDPVTFGHLDIIERASRCYDEVIVAVLENKAKYPLFSVEERVRMLEDATCKWPNLRVLSFTGMLVDFVREVEADVVIRGLRSALDYEYEMQMVQVNRQLGATYETIFMPASLSYTNLSSSAVREIASYGKDLEQFVPSTVSEKIQEKMKEKECVQDE